MNLSTESINITGRPLRLRAFALAIGLCSALLAATPAAGQAGESGSVSSGSPIKLRDGTSAPVERKVDGSPRADDGSSLRRSTPPPAYKPGEFERYVQRLQGAAEVRRLGAVLVDGNIDIDPTAGNNPLVPPDYILQSGDEIALTLWGSVEADMRLTVDRVGRITVPRVGTVMIAGVRHADLADVIGRRVAQIFKNFQISVSLGQLRGMRVFVTGFVAKPGAVSVSSLSTLSQALLRAGGPAAAGSFRKVQLRRGRETVAVFDLYDLLLKGDRSADRVLQPDDVIHVEPVGALVAVIGSINRPAVFELRPDETAADVLRMAGGFSAVADTSRLALERVSERATVRVSLIEQPESLPFVLVNGDVLRAYSAVDTKQSAVPNNKRVRVEGEVQRPGEYLLPPNSSLADALRAAGGTTGNSFLFGTEFNRESVRQTQAVNYERALRDFETELVRMPVTQHAATRDEADVVASRAEAGTRLLEKLREVKPTGRIVLQLQPDTPSLPEMALEDGDRLYIPPRPTTVGVFGSVFSAGSYLHAQGRTVGDYLQLAGGPMRRADEASVFVVRANGTVRSSLAATNWLSRGNQISGLLTEPGDTVFVPDEINRITWVGAAKDWTQILYQFGLGIAGIKSAFR